MRISCRRTPYLVFSIHTVTPQLFTRNEQIEVATVDGAFSTVLARAPAP